MRLFLSLDVPSIRIEDAKLRKLKSYLSSHSIEHRIVPNELLYIPLMEIGDLGQGGFLATFDRMKTLAAGIESFDLKVSGLWGHPYQKEADMLWLGVQNSKKLQYLQETMAQELGIGPQKLIRPHIPLIYLKRKRDVTDLISPFKKLDLGKILISRISLQEKLPANAGARRLASCDLKHAEEGDQIWI